MELCLLTILAVAGGDETCTDPDRICSPGVLGGIAGGGPLLTDVWVCTLTGCADTGDTVGGNVGGNTFGGSLDGGDVCDGRRAGSAGNFDGGCTGSAWVVIIGAICGTGFCCVAVWGLLMIVWSFGLDCWGKWVC